MACLICNRPLHESYTICRDKGLNCDERRLKKIEDARKADNSVRSIDTAKAYSDKLRDAELMMGELS